MDTIFITTSTYANVKDFYLDCTTPELRALFGYMLKTGNAHNPTLGGAFFVLRDIQNSKKTYKLMPKVSYNKESEIINIVDTVLSGGLREFALTPREIKDTLNALFKYAWQKGKSTMTLEEYIEEKLELLKEFAIHPKAYELRHFESLTSEIQVDNYVRDLFKKYL